MNTTPPPKKMIADFLFRDRASFVYVFIAAIVLFFGFLGAKELWTQEWRFADICQQMLLRHDFLHPYLAGYPYYDKPLLTYWLMIGFAQIFKNLNLWAIRLPSACAGLIVVYCTYLLGKILSSKTTGLLAAWMLITSFYFVFWVRVGSSDMLNVAGIMLATTWYFTRRNQPNFITYLVFFSLLAVTSLLKGPIAAAVVLIAILPDLLYQKNWKTHINSALFISIILAILLYLLPFVASLFINPNHYPENGLLIAFHENFLRYVAPFDHKDPIFTYCIYLPIAMAPWILLTIPAILIFPFRWRNLLPGARWFFWSSLLVFLFFTLSGSRRSYYVLPIVPFVLLLTADFANAFLQKHVSLNRSLGHLILLIYAILALIFLVVIPLAYKDGGGAKAFAEIVKKQAEITRPFNSWKIVLIESPNKISFYLNSPNLTYISPKSSNMILDRYPVLKQKNNHVIFIIGNSLTETVKPYLPEYMQITWPLNYWEVWLQRIYKKYNPNTQDLATAWIPPAILPEDLIDYLKSS